MERHRKKVENYAESNVSFPTKLYALMANEQGSSVEWAPHGFAFKISDQNAFLRQVIPKYFRHTKLTSFQRQLNLYGFRRVLKGDDEGAYYHPKFQKGKRDLISEIQRLPSKQSLMSLQDIMDECSHPDSFQLNSSSSSSKAKKSSSPPVLEGTNGRKKKATSSSIAVEREDSDADNKLAITSATTSFHTTYVRTNPRPKRTLTPSAASTASATTPRAVVPRTSRNSARKDPSPPNPSSESAFSATDEEQSSAGGRRGGRASRGRRATPARSKLTVDTDYTEGGDSLLSYANSLNTHVGRYSASAYPTHDDCLDLSLTSPLFGPSDMLDPAPPQSLTRSAALSSPTSLAVATATAQADFGSSLAQSQHGADFAGLSNPQDDLAWTQHYSLGALGSLPLIMDYSPHGSTPAERPRSSSSAVGAGSGCGGGVFYMAGAGSGSGSGSGSSDSSGPGLSPADHHAPQAVGPCVGGLRDAFDDLLDFFEPLAGSQDAALLTAPSTSMDASSSSSTSGYTALAPAERMFEGPGVNGAAQTKVNAPA